MSATITIIEKRNEDGSMGLSLVSDNTEATPFEDKYLQQLMKAIAISSYEAGCSYEEDDE